MKGGEELTVRLEERAEKLDRLKEILQEDERILIAFSGGLDSSFLASVAAEVLGDGALLVTLDSEAIPRSELLEAEEMARSLDFRHRIVGYRILESEDIAKNPPDRCALCKRRIAKALQEIAEEEGIGRVADGVNLSDYADFRPGIRASDEEGIIHPLAEAGLTKPDIRDLAKEMGLPFWDKPSMACLASRIPYGERITPDKLRMAEEAEEFLMGRGFRTVRVRVSGRSARIEVEKTDLEKILGMREEVVRELRRVGFLYVSLDLEGYRTGSANEVL
ncbi:ATP-dependent sacrificial sulfur transferase LarE [Candidatus Methanocrinis natronophilus]|uniref:ATP-dependent sacrificial sulfur transferase LarE n=1 Tax=Candidatus Methanocrinis natronophilus TaxID=3033396 RepID=A0ABT5X526_9EURY|nr:ATP-dependent sacrificial sulfur transferase LarE [Candidatus Methanocrinis natronophilus]MDF0589801.1 ATP-dependent sacrificial sulfur transferase LarE [Candidatus Methanocrinis natronophilus]